MIKSKLLILVPFIAFVTWNFAFAQKPEKIQFLSANWSFIENKGQLADEKGNILSDILYYGKDKGVNVYCRQQVLSFVFTKTTYKKLSITPEEEYSKNHNPEVVKMDYSRMDMHFIGSNLNAQIIASKQKSEYLNFYLAHTPERGINGVHIFEQLIYKNLYSNIDLILYVKDRGMKYEFVIHPGGNPNDIKIKWEGTKPELLLDGGIKYENELATLHESQPITFIQGEQEISSKFSLDQEDNIFFNLGEYDGNKTLVIDPTLSWATYYGGSESESGGSVALDDSKNIYKVGNTSSTSGIATSGAFQTSFAGGVGKDGFIVKFNGNGGIYWATYFGGTAEDYFKSIGLDKIGNLYVLGYTESSGLSTSGAYQTSLSGNMDALIAKFSKTGNRIWSTYFGGSDIERAYGISTNDSGTLFITGFTQSTSGIATSGAWQTTQAGNYDAYIAGFNNKGGIIWSTYYGSSDRDVGNGLSQDDSGNVYITGMTLSASGMASSGSYQSSNAGNEDVFIAKFNKNGKRIWGTYYGGTLTEYGYGISFSPSGYLLIGGHTTSSSGIATTGAYQTTKGGGMDAFVAKFSNNGSMQWATYFGGSNSDGFQTNCLTSSESIFITGATASSSGIATSGAYQKSFGGGVQDAYIAQFHMNGKLLYATYYGGSDQDGGEAIACKPGTVVVTGITKSTSNIATSGAYKTSYSGNMDAFLAKFQFCIPTDSTIIKEVCDSFVLNNIIYRKSGTYTQTKTNSVQCDSTITLKLKILSSSSTVIKSACDSFEFNGKVYYETGNYIQKTKNKVGCDSTITIKLAIKKSTDTIIVASACLYYTLNSITYDSSGIYTQKLSNKAGCDSLITLHLTIGGENDTLIKHKACNYCILNGIYYNATGTYTQTLTNSKGCDSIITLELTIRQSSAYELKVTACDSFVLNGISYHADGTYMQTLTNASGCDSLLTLKLNIIKSSDYTINQSSCGSFALNGISYNSSGTFIQKRSNSVGCDSTIILNLIINKFADPRFNVSIVKNDVTFTPMELNAKSYAWDFGNTSTSILKSPVYRYPSIGNYKVLLKIISNDDCASQYDTTLSITSVGSIYPNSKNAISIFPNPAKNEVTIYGLTGKAILTLMDASGRIIVVKDFEEGSIINTQDLDRGLYLLQISDENGYCFKKVILK